MNRPRLIWLACWTAAAMAAESAPERGKRVVEEALQALGGPAFQKVEDRLESGRAYSFFNGELNGLSIARIYTRYLVRPEPPIPGKLNQRERQSFGKVESSAVLFTEEGAWEITYRGAKPLEDLRYANYQDSVQRNIFYILRQRLGEPGLTFYSMGSDRYNNHPVEIVDITDATNLTVTVYFDQFSKLPVKQTFRRRNAEFKDFDTEVSLFAKFRDVGGGVKWPFDIRRDRNGEKIFEMYADSVTINKNLTDDLFMLPANLKILPKPK